MLHTIPAAEAMTVPQLREFGHLHGPEYTATGIVCAECTAHYRRFADKPVQVRHATVEHVRFCHYVTAERDAQAKDELDAEMAAERFFEEGPHGTQDDPRERALWALEDARRGY